MFISAKYVRLKWNILNNHYEDCYYVYYNLQALKISIE